METPLLHAPSSMQDLSMFFSIWTEKVKYRWDLLHITKPCSAPLFLDKEPVAASSETKATVHVQKYQMSRPGMLSWKRCRGFRHPEPCAHRRKCPRGSSSPASRPGHS
ncbi:hypothetical protein M0657_009134 [Pyricularia oryzae]|nr:hypothetical protein M9X92_008969 [Pyricularia oryzae]KAI7915303.1 hypothetical protein M0657_009134 [Pyricularia oryzae]